MNDTLFDKNQRISQLEKRLESEHNINTDNVKMKAYYDQKDLALIQKDKEIIGVNEELKNLKLYYREV